MLSQISGPGIFLDLPTPHNNHAMTTAEQIAAELIASEKVEKQTCRAGCRNYIPTEVANTLSNDEVKCLMEGSSDFGVSRGLMRVLETRWEKIQRHKFLEEQFMQFLNETLTGAGEWIHQLSDMAKRQFGDHCTKPFIEAVIRKHPDKFCFRLQPYGDLESDVRLAVFRGKAELPEKLMEQSLPLLVS